MMPLLLSGSLISGDAMRSKVQCSSPTELASRLLSTM